MGINPAQITDAMRRRMPKSEQKFYGKPFEEQVIELEAKNELEMHSQYMSYLDRHGIEIVWHADPTRKATIKPGLPDFAVCHGPPFKMLFIEFKAGKNKLSKEQDHFKNRILAAGGWYVIAYSYLTARDATQEFFKLGEMIE